jgi:group II intron reverse transcriptase/maturase
MGATEYPQDTATKLQRINQLSGKDRDARFNNLMYLYNEESLTACFHELDGTKAVGMDGRSKGDYGRDLDANIADLVARMKRFAYRPGPVRQALIPKEGQPGEFRPLGICNFEDKIVQSMTRLILERIYEPLFLSCSYGFRPGRGPHDAIRDMRSHLFSNDVQVVIDVDLANYFGTIDHKILGELLRDKITDQKFLRYIARMFKAGVLAEGELTVTDEGVPQGSICSPVLSNIMAHHVIDLWFEKTVKQHCRGKV